MEVKKFVFCVLFFTHAINSAEEDNSDNKKFSFSTVEEDILINKNDWNTSKWGDLYFLFPHLNFINIILKCIAKSFSFRGELEKGWVKIFNFIVSGVMEYKYMFHKYCGINVRLNLNNLESFEGQDISFLSLETSLEWIYGRKGKHIFSGSFSPLGFAIVQKENGSCADDCGKKGWTWGFVLLKYEYDRRFYLNFGRVKTMWYMLKDISEKDFWETIGYNLLSIEFGLNIIGVNDWRKKEKKILKYNQYKNITKRNFIINFIKKFIF